MRQKLAHWNTLRNQMLVGFLFVMIIVLILAGIITFHSVSTLLKDKAEKQIKQTAIQANGRMEALIRQIDTLTTQAVNDSFLQQLLLSEVNGKPATFDQRQALMQIANKIQVYTSGVTSVEVYTREYKRLYPLDDQSLHSRVENEWIQKADSEKGRLIWIGMDPRDQDSVLAIRRINLIDRWFSNGGYLLIRLKRNYFEFQESLQEDKPKEIMLLVDSASRPIIAGGENLDTWRISTSDEYNFVRMPKLLIQPLVENAILHGLEGKTGQGLVTVSVTKSPQSPNLVITVSDDGPGMEGHTLQAIKDSLKNGKVPSGKGKGVGISNVQRRLKLYYSALDAHHGGLLIESKRGTGTRVSFEIPADKEERHDSLAENHYDR